MKTEKNTTNTVTGYLLLDAPLPHPMPPRGFGGGRAGRGGASGPVPGGASTMMIMLGSGLELAKNNK